MVWALDHPTPVGWSRAGQSQPAYQAENVAGAEPVDQAQTVAAAHRKHHVHAVSCGPPLLPYAPALLLIAHEGNDTLGGMSALNGLTVYGDCAQR